jgi:hypothetical protein
MPVWGLAWCGDITQAMVNGARSRRERGVEAIAAIAQFPCVDARRLPAVPVRAEALPRREAAHARPSRMRSDCSATVAIRAMRPANRSRIEMKTNLPIPFKPLLAAIALVLATSACQQRTDDTLATPTDDAATVPAQTAPADTMAPPVQEVDPCAGLMGTELDECLRRQNELTAPPMMEEGQMPPPDTTGDTTQPTTPPPPQ